MNAALTGALRTAADEGDVHVEQLLAGARRGGVRHRRRRRFAISCGAVLSVALAAGALAAVRPPAGGPSLGGVPGAPSASSPPAAAAPRPSTSPSSPPAALMTELPALPDAPGSATVLAAPADVGRNPLLVHVSLAKLPFAARTVQWTTGDGRESIWIEGTSNLAVQVSRNVADLDPLSGARDDATVGGRPAAVAVDTAAGRRQATVRWQPVDGLWAQVSGGLDRNQALAVAHDVRFDRVYRCAVPFRLTGAPPGAKVTTCNLSFLGSAVLASATVRISDWHVTASLMPGTVTDPNETLGGHPAHVTEQRGDGGSKIMEIRVDLGGQVADFTAEGTYDPAVVRSLAAGFTPAGGPGTADWPTSPLS